MQLCANKLDKKDFFGKSDPFLVFYRSNEDGTWVGARKTDSFTHCMSLTFCHPLSCPGENPNMWTAGRDVNTFEWIIQLRTDSMFCRWYFTWQWRMHGKWPREVSHFFSVNSSNRLNFHPKPPPFVRSASSFKQDNVMQYGWKWFQLVKPPLFYFQYLFPLIFCIHAVLDHLNKNAYLIN